MSWDVGNVYVCDAGAGLVKVGRSRTPERRVKSIRTTVGSVNFKNWISQPVFDYQRACQNFCVEPGS